MKKAVAISLLAFGVISCALTPEQQAQRLAYQQWALENPGEAERLRIEQMQADQSISNALMLMGIQQQQQQQQRFETTCQFIGNMMVCN